MLTLGMPDQHQGFIEFWESQGGTIGTPPPMTNFINKQLTKLLNNHIEAPKEKNKNPTANVHYGLFMVMKLNMMKLNVMGHRTPLDIFINMYNKHA